jgi:hypothetical protein
MSNAVVNRAVIIGVDSASEPSIQAVVNNSDVPRQLSINPLGGNVGIGTVSPVERLHVETSNEYQITWARTGAGKRWAIGIDTAGFYFNNRTDSVLPLYITNGGNVLIGTTNDNANKLRVNGTIFSDSSVTATNYIASAGNNSVIFSSSAATTGYQYLSLANTTAQLVMGINNSTGSFLTSSLAYASFISTGLGSTSLQFGTNNAIKMTITSGGNVLIGTTTDDNITKLQVNGAIITSNPSGDTARPFKVGSVNFESDKSFAGNILKVEVNGTIYRLMIAE